MNTQQAGRKVNAQHSPLKDGQVMTMVREQFLASLKAKKSFTTKEVQAFMQTRRPERYVHQAEGFATVIEPLLFERRIRRVERGHYEVVVTTKEVS